MKNITHVVHVMLENRSLDNVLGWLYASGSPSHFLPAGSAAVYDGLQTPGEHSNSYDGRTFPARKGTKGDTGHEGIPAQPLRVPGFDPGEKFEHVNQQLFGGPDHPTNENPSKGTAAPMKGFAYDYDAWYEEWDQLAQIMEAYTPEQLPVLNGLARAYAVSDAWYASVPSQTNPNRAFSICGTSLGRVNNLHLDAVEQFDTPTIWNALPKGTKWGIYYHDIWWSGKCYTEHTFPRCAEALDDGEIRPIDEFYAKARSGELPAFTYLEPKWGYGMGLPNGSGFFCDLKLGAQGNDYHPPTWVGPGEAFLNRVYEALVANPEAWARTLLVITFDEHGGTYDHVDPGWDAVAPDGHRGPDGFGFDRYGVRVPAILVSPWVRPGTVFRAENGKKLDHTSLLATLLRWQGADPACSGLGARTAVAPTFEHVFADSIQVPDPPHFVVPAGYADQGHDCWHEGESALPPSIGRWLCERCNTVDDFLEQAREWIAGQRR